MLTLMLTLSTTLALQRWVTRAREALRAFYTVQAGRLAETDGLTGSHNLTGLRLELGRYIDAQRPFALLKVSVRNLEVIGDIYGNAFSERALVEFSTHIENVARQFCGEGSRDALVARDHSGEFYVLLDTAAVGSAGEWFSRALVNSVSDEFRISGMAYPLVIAVGLTKYPTDALSAEELLVNASESSQLASSRGPNVVEIFSTQVERQIASRKAVEEGLTESLEAGQFELNFMPIVSCGSRSVSGCEVLLRCTHPKLAGVSPEVFITLAERTRLILRIDEWVIDHALEALAAMIAEGYGGSMAVNISALELQNGAFPELVEALLLKHGVEAHRLELELTETALVNNDEQGVAMLARLKRIGVVLSLDDFGTGYTAFSQLMHYPVDSLKIDKSFVTGLRSLDSAQGRLIKVILGLAEIYALKVTVEGIETDEEAALLKSMGCQLGQGYLFSKPVPLEQFRAMVLA